MHMAKIEVSKDINALVRTWLHSSTKEKDSIKLPTPPKIVQWTERRGLGTERISVKERKKAIIHDKIKKKLKLKKQNDATTVVDGYKHVDDESKSDVVLASLKRKQKADPEAMTKGKRKKNIGNS